MNKVTFVFLMMAAAPALADPPATKQVIGINLDGKNGLNDMLALCLLFGAPALVTALALYWKHRRRMEHEKTLRLAIEKGTEVPAELLATLKAMSEKPAEKQRDLPSAVFVGCVLLGVACIIYERSAGVPLFFVFLAAGGVLRAYLSKKTLVGVGAYLCLPTLPVPAIFALLLGFTVYAWQDA